MAKESQVNPNQRRVPVRPSRVDQAYPAPRVLSQRLTINFWRRLMMKPKDHDRGGRCPGQAVKFRGCDLGRGIDA